jgi:hypothetical protein
MMRFTGRAKFDVRRLPLLPFPFQRPKKIAIAINVKSPLRAVQSVTISANMRKAQVIDIL